MGGRKSTKEKRRTLVLTFRQNLNKKNSKLNTFKIRAPDESSQLGPSHESSRVESSRVGKFRTRDLARVRRDLTR